MDVLTIAANICTILAFLMSATALYKIFRLEQNIKISGDYNKSLNQNIKGDGNFQIGKQ